MFSSGLPANNIPKKTCLNKILIIMGLGGMKGEQEWINMHKKFDNSL
jgi:hypothetical protein